MRIIDAIVADAEFWLTIIFGAAIKPLLSERHSWLRSLASAASAIWLASIATNPLLKWLDLSPSDYRIPVAAFFAIAGDSIIRWIIIKTNDGDFLSGIFAKWMKK